MTEITAEVGGGVGGAGGAFGGLLLLPEPFDPVPLRPDEPLVDEPGPPAWNGSLLSKSENDCSWPTLAGAWTAETSCCEIEPDDAGVDVPVGVTPPSVGAAGSGVDEGAGVDVPVVVTAGAASGFEPPPLLRAIIVWTPYASAAASTTPSTMTIFFCFSAFAFA